MTGGFHHLWCQRAFTQMVPHTFPWELVGADAARAESACMKTIVIQHVEALQFPSLPFFGVHAKTESMYAPSESTNLSAPLKVRCIRCGV